MRTLFVSLLLLSLSLPVVADAAPLQATLTLDKVKRTFPMGTPRPVVGKFHLDAEDGLAIHELFFITEGRLASGKVAPEKLSEAINFVEIWNKQRRSTVRGRYVANLSNQRRAVYRFTDFFMLPNDDWEVRVLPRNKSYEEFRFSVCSIENPNCPRGAAADAETVAQEEIEFTAPRWEWQWTKIARMR